MSEERVTSKPPLGTPLDHPATPPTPGGSQRPRGVSRDIQSEDRPRSQSPRASQPSRSTFSFSRLLRSTSFKGSEA